VKRENQKIITKLLTPHTIAAIILGKDLTFTNEGRTEMLETSLVDIPQGDPELVSSTATRADGTVQSDACYTSTNPLSGPYHFRCELLGPLGPGETLSVDITVIYREAGTFDNQACSSWGDFPPPGVDRTRELARQCATTPVEVLAVPTTKAQCKKGGYSEFGFASQKECMAFVKARA
jgi:hypothetical protein